LYSKLLVLPTRLVQSICDGSVTPTDFRLFPVHVLHQVQNAPLLEVQFLIWFIIFKLCRSTSPAFRTSWHISLLMLHGRTVMAVMTQRKWM